MEQKQNQTDKPKLRKIANVRRRIFVLHYDILANPNLTSSDKLVYSALAAFANIETQISYPKIQTLAKLTSLHRQTVIQSIKNLEKELLLQVIRNTGRSNKCILLEPPNIEREILCKTNDPLEIPTGTIIGTAAHRKGELLPTEKENSNNSINNSINNPEQSSATDTSLSDKKITTKKENVLPWNTHEKIYQYIHEFDEKGNKLDTDGAKEFKILAYYLILNSQKIENRVQWNSFVKRNIRIVRKLTEQGWDCKRICLTALMLGAKELSWSLETIESWLPRLDKELSHQKPDEESRYKDLYEELKVNLSKLNDKYGNK